MGLINNLKFGEFEKAINSIDTMKIVELLQGWGQKYFGDKWKDYLNIVRRFLSKIVFQIGEVIK